MNDIVKFFKLEGMEIFKIKYKVLKKEFNDNLKRSKREYYSNELCKTQNVNKKLVHGITKNKKLYDNRNIQIVNGNNKQ